MAARGDADRAAEFVDKADRMFRDTGDALGRVRAANALARLAMARGETGRPELVRARRLVRRAGVGPKSEVASLVVALAEAVQKRRRRATARG